MRSSFAFSFSIFLFLFSIVYAKLSPDYYATSCPKALSTIQAEVSKAVAKERRMGASLLRLHFHDCWVNGCDASVLVDDNEMFQGEKRTRYNLESLRGFEVIDSIKSQIEHICPGVVSCADILTVAARDSVVALGGPSWIVPLGRRDTTIVDVYKPDHELFSEFSSLTTQLMKFSMKGFTAQEVVALLGAHSIGTTKCINFRYRIYYSPEKNINSSFKESLKKVCPEDGVYEEVGLDETDTIFDNVYYRDLMEFRGVMRSDQELYNNGSTDSMVKTYSENSKKFFLDFANVMIKLGYLSPLTGSEGEVRTNCRKLNWF